MLLAVDIGNTNITVGFFENDTLIYTFRLITQHKQTSDQYSLTLKTLLKEMNKPVSSVDGIIISSVVPKVMHSFETAIVKTFNKKPILVNTSIQLPITIDLDNPKELGADRIVAAVSASTKWDKDILVIDFGTATTFDYISKDKIFKGDVIIAGIQITAEALWSKTAKLPEFEIKPASSILGKNTIDSMQAGLFYGYIGQCKYIIQQFKQQTNKDLLVVATGGLGRIVYEHIDEISYYEPNLVFDGLLQLYKLNA